MKRRVLVVDDEQGYRDLFTYLLEPMGIEVNCVEDGEKAVAKIEASAYDLVLMDVHMPRLSGPEALKKIKDMRPEQKVVIFSSSSDPAYIYENEACKDGAMECLFKPVYLDDIQRVLAKAIGPLPAN